MPGEARTIEPVDVVETWRLGFHLGNAIMLLYEGAHGGDVEILEKARWHLSREIRERMGKL
jgi:hypothetical protein